MTTPIALFAYNRPTHLRLALETLTRCERFDECRLYIFCDGARRPEHVEGVEAARRVARDRAARGAAIVVERDVNLGLARSIVTGVTDLCEQYGRVIVVEDDLAVSPDFLNYMLQTLDRYETESNVYQISGYMFPVTHPEHPDAFFLPLTTTWGWATWARAWHSFDWNATGALEQLANIETRHRFDLNGSYPYTDMLKQRLAGRNDSWGILWWWAVFQAGGYALHPRRTLVSVGGFDGSGTHYGPNSPIQVINHDKVRQASLPEQLELPDQVGPDTSAMCRIESFLTIQATASKVPIVNRVLGRVKQTVRKFGLK